jgi:hypothetical protein
LLIVIVWWAALVLVVGGLLLRIPTQVDVTDSELRWRTPLRRGTVPLHALRRVRAIYYPVLAVVIKADDNPGLWLFAQPATSELVEHLGALAPQLEVRSLPRGRFSWRTYRYSRLG